ncbi:MAG: thiamine phosphate synthase [bacterium]|jgi:thiamine-phosphate pyrophosphorylase|nr:thiamine phosphate synthase [candidate division KSB1 bacterium]MDH7559843.1 thiamine phosphate synthase [bacterium]
MHSGRAAIDFSLYGIIDCGWLRGREIAAVVEAAIAGGVTVVQYRDKVSSGRLFYENALAAQRVCAAHGVPFLVNDRLDIAMAVYADGVHVGQEDLPVAVVRRVAGPEMLIGASAGTVAEALAAEAEGADYVGVGAIFPTATKPDADLSSLQRLREICQRVRCPVVAIGGITAQRVAEVMAAGAHGVAVISALMDGDVQANARLLRESIRRCKEVDRR